MIRHNGYQQCAGIKYYHRTGFYGSYPDLPRSDSLLLRGSEATVGYARDYMVVILWGNVITHLYLGLNAVLRSAGHPQKAMYATIATVVINTILDPIFIYGFGWEYRVRLSLRLPHRSSHFSGSSSCLVIRTNSCIFIKAFSD